MFKQENWMSFLERKKKEIEPKAEPYYEEPETTYVDIEGNILHIWHMKDGRVSWNVERLK